MIPELRRGLLPEGVHPATLAEIRDHFGIQGVRAVLTGALNELFEYAKRRGAAYIVLGGSFVADDDAPEDLDALLVFPTKASIPDAPPDVFRQNVRIDVQYASEDEPLLLAALFALFRTTRRGESVGVLRVDVERPTVRIESLPDPPSDLVETVRAIYGGRGLGSSGGRRGLLITLHGIRTTAPWNAELSRYASSQGWVVAPFLYGDRGPMILLQKGEQSRILGRFREWLDQLADEENLPISVVAHSFGTVLLMKYLLGYGTPSRKFAGVILANAILNEKRSWGKELQGRVGRILHERTGGDNWVRRAGLLRALTGDQYLGKAGVSGVVNEASMIDEHSSELHTHGDVIKRDVIKGRWLPFLNIQNALTP